MSAHLPIRIARPLYRQCVFQPGMTASARPFSTTIARPARKGRIDPVVAEVGALQQTRAAEASAVKRHEQMKDVRNIPDDVGLLPGTFIRAPLRRLMKDLSWSKPKTWKTLLWYYWKLAESKGKSWIILWRFRKISPECPPLYFTDRKTIRDLAARKYRTLYLCYANGDKKTISDICASGVASAFNRRISRRAPSFKMQWTSDKSPKTYIVSNRANAYTGGAGSETSGIQQIVVRVKSAWQVLEVKDNATTPRTNTRKEGKNVVEYIVLQRQVANGEFKDWKVWGFTDEWMPETILEDEELDRQISSYQSNIA